MTLAYITRGDGTRPVLMLHGFLASSRVLAPLARRWVIADPDRQLLIPDLPGHGDSPSLPPDSDLPDATHAVLDFLDRTTPGTPIPIVAHSMGARVALHLALEHPDRVGYLAVLDVPAGRLSERPSPLTDMMRALLDAPEHAPNPASMTRALLDRGIPPAHVKLLEGQLVAGDDGVRWRIDRHRLASWRANTMRRDLRPALTRVDTLLVHGEHSDFVHPSDVREYEAAGARIRRIDGAGHDLHITAPRKVLAHLREAFTAAGV